MSTTAKPDTLLPSIHQPCENDFELLRKADAGLEKQVASLSVTRLALIVILTFLFASGLHRRNDEAKHSYLAYTTLYDQLAGFDVERGA